MATSVSELSLPTPDNLGYRSALASVQRNPTATQLQTLWFTICASFFPSPEGYKIAILSGDDDTTRVGRITEVHVRPTESNTPRTAEDLVERVVFCVVCKAPQGNVSEDLPFDDVGVTESGLGERGFAAIAVGTKIKFYKLDRQPGGRALIQELQPGIIDVNHETERLEKYLLDVKRQGWNWTI